MFKIMVTTDLGGIALPPGSELIDENVKMRVPHGDGGSEDFLKGESDGESVAHLWLAHVRLELEKDPLALYEATGLDSGPSSYLYLFPSPLRN